MDQQIGAEHRGASFLLPAAAGMLGTLLLAAYFGAPAVSGWPNAGGPASQIAAYATSHTALFFAGAWLQVTGTLLAVVMFLSIVAAAKAVGSTPGLVAIVAAAVLLATVVIDAAFLVAVPVAAQNGDLGMVSTMFTLSNGVFLRVFAMGPAATLLVALGLVIVRTRVLAPWVGLTAIGLGSAFELAAIAAIFSPAGVVLAVVLSVVQAAWILAAAVTVVMSRSFRGNLIGNP